MYSRNIPSNGRRRLSPISKETAKSPRLVMETALPNYSSIPRFYQPVEGIRMGKSRCWRFVEYTEETAKGRLPHSPSRYKRKAAAYCLHADASSGVHSAVTTMKNISFAPSENLQEIASTRTQSLMVADLDPGTAKLLMGLAGPFLSAFGFLFILRIVMSWYPKLPVDKFPYVIAFAPTEPFLVITRKVIPPLGGVDVTPVVWFGLVSFLNEILVGPQGLLVLLSQQVYKI
ncbi:hypothetical protein AXF42_Ash013309 [Apostasia shenzhenica]|uniref:Protein COFACTOR ASSEMBLY OF COMPLEX C SUBUNIT B CCB3, chloroplastic n=1 Tax=Apostasia shenzhenica TaxID=1088818 RepID=A0A2I0BBK9_9ASPA|nr:hypothetical protein AXF42_Ash013309 [Apostasia shenzhenica]